MVNISESGVGVNSQSVGRPVVTVAVEPLDDVAAADLVTKEIIIRYISISTLWRKSQDIRSSLFDIRGSSNNYLLYYSMGYAVYRCAHLMSLTR